MASKTMRFGILGMGSIGQRHYKNLKLLGHDVYFYDPDPPLISLNHNVNHISRDGCINWAEAIIVCSPSKNHAHDLMDALSADKHCFVEKPFGYDCPELLDGFMQGVRARNPSLVVATGFNLRFHECVKKAKVLLPHMGAIKAAKFHVLQKTTKPPYLRDGIIRNWCSHELDLATHLLGPLDVVECHATHDENGRDTTDCIIKLSSVEKMRGKAAFNVHIEADYVTDPERRGFWVEAEIGTLYCDLVARTLRAEAKYVPKYFPEFFKAEDSYDANYISEMIDFIRCCQSGRTHFPESLASGEEGVTNLYMIMRARELAAVND